MKQYHEAARIFENGKAVEYFILDTYNLKNPSDQRAMLSLPFAKVSASKFEQFVQQDQVQLLIWDNGNLVGHFTDEEKKIYSKTGFKKDFLQHMEQNYWKADPTFNKVHIDFADAGQALAVCTSEIISVLKVQIISFMVYGQEQIINKILGRVAQLKRPLITIGAKSTNHFTCFAPLILPNLTTVLSDILGVDCPILIETATLKNTIDSSEQKASLFAKTVAFNGVTSIIDELDALTASNLYQLNSGAKAAVEHYEKAAETHLF